MGKMGYRNIIANDWTYENMLKRHLERIRWKNKNESLWKREQNWINKKEIARKEKGWGD